MKNYTPHHLYEIYDYRPDWGSDAPRLPTSKDLIDMKKGWVKGLESEPDEYDMKDIIRDIMADDHTEQDEMIDFTENLNSRFEENLGAICSSAAVLDKILANGEMTKEEIIEWVDCARDTLTSVLPQTQSIKMWDQARLLHKGIRKFLLRVPTIWRRRLKVDYTEGNATNLTDECEYLSTSLVLRGGSLCITDKNKSPESLSISDPTVTFTQGEKKKIILSWDILDEVFSDWVHPTQEEIDLFQMLYGYSFDIRKLISKLESDTKP